MLVWGDLVWIPFGFAIQPWYLLANQIDLNILEICLFIILFAFGFWIFQQSNYQKYIFKNFPKQKIWGKEPETIDGRLLVSGFWGYLRKPNYIGDWIVAIGLSLPCLFNSIVPYIYPLYLISLDLHRERRDYHRCAIKYGATWKKYCERVKWVVVPYIY